MDQNTHHQGLQIRKAVPGEARVNTALKNADGFNQPFQELVTDYCRSVLRSRDELPRKIRSMFGTAMISPEVFAEPGRA